MLLYGCFVITMRVCLWGLIFYLGLRCEGSSIFRIFYDRTMYILVSFFFGIGLCLLLFILIQNRYHVLVPSYYLIYHVGAFSQFSAQDFFCKYIQCWAFTWEIKRARSFSQKHQVITVLTSNQWSAFSNHQKSHLTYQQFLFSIYASQAYHTKLHFLEQIQILPVESLVDYNEILLFDCHPLTETTSLQIASSVAFLS